MQAYLGTIVFKFGRDPVICQREEVYTVHVHYVHYVHGDEQITILRSR